MSDSIPSRTLDMETTEEVFDVQIIHDYLSEKYVKLFDQYIFYCMYLLYVYHRYLSEVRQIWYCCKCCICEYPESNMRRAKKEHEKHHDCLYDDIICLFCCDFVPTNDLPFCPRSRFRNKMEIPATPVCLNLGFLEQRAVALMHCYISILIVRGHQSAMKGQVVHCQADVVENIGDLLPLPKCYEFMAVIQQKPVNDQGEITSTVRYSVSAIQILNALLYLVQHHVAYKNKQIMSLNKIEEMFKCRKEELSSIRVIDSYAYNNSTTSSPIILDHNEDFFGPTYDLKFEFLLAIIHSIL